MPIDTPEDRGSSGSPQALGAGVATDDNAWDADALRLTTSSPEHDYFVTRWLAKPTGSIAATIT